MKKLLLFGLVIVLAFVASPVQASTIVGHTVNVTHFFPDLSTVNLDMGGQVVPTGDFNYYDVYDLQVFGDHLTWDVHCGAGCSWVSADFNGPVLTDLTAGVFTGAWIDATSSYAGFTASRLTWDASHIYINAEGLDANGYLRVNFTNPVPEPASLLLLGTGLVGAVRAVRRRRG